MKQTINFYDFERAFDLMGRKDSFSYEGKRALFEYLEELEEEIELDVIELCCDWSEYDSIDEFWVNYGKDNYPDLEAIENETNLVMTGNENEPFLVRSF